MKSKIKLLFKMFYVLIPRIIREQFLDDSLYLYRETFSKLVEKFFNGKEKASLSEIKELNLIKKVEDLECEYEVLFNKVNRENHIKSPKLYLDGKNYFKPEIEGNLPDINIYNFKKVSVVGSTDAIVCKDHFLHHELNLMETWHDLKRWDIFTKIDEEKYELNLKYSKDELSIKRSKIYISLLKEHSVNYYHFMTEGLPRLIQIVDVLREKNEQFNSEDYALLVDDEMPKQCIEAIELVLNSSIEIVFVKKGEIFYCEELIYCTPMWTSLDNTTGLPNPKKEFFVDKYAINLVKESILSNFVTKTKTTNKLRKVYLQRLNNKLRPISNLKQLEVLLLKNDFEFVDVGSLDLKEQIELFQSVDIIVGASGVAFTNLIFMKENSIAISFYPSASATNYYVFQPLSDVSNVELVHFLTTSSNVDLSVHAEASIDLDNLNLLLKEKNDKL